MKGRRRFAYASLVVEHRQPFMQSVSLRENRRIPNSTPIKRLNSLHVSTNGLELDRWTERVVGERDCATDDSHSSRVSRRVSTRHARVRALRHHELAHAIGAVLHLMEGIRDVVERARVRDHGGKP